MGKVRRTRRRFKIKKKRKRREKIKKLKEKYLAAKTKKEKDKIVKKLKRLSPFYPIEKIKEPPLKTKKTSTSSGETKSEE